MRTLLRWLLYVSPLIVSLPLFATGVCVATRGRCPRPLAALAGGVAVDDEALASVLGALFIGLAVATLAGLGAVVLTTRIMRATRFLRDSLADLPTHVERIAREAATTGRPRELRWEREGLQSALGERLAETEVRLTSGWRFLAGLVIIAALMALVLLVVLNLTTSPSQQSERRAPPAASRPTR